MSETLRARLANEEWRQIPALPGYEASSNGRIRSVDRVVIDALGRRQNCRGRVLCLVPMKKGYLLFGTTGRRYLVSRAVLSAFVGEQPEGMQACHNDGDKSNNRIENLRWDTSKGNNADKLKHGTLLCGERHGAAKLTEQQVEAIRLDGRTAKTIAADYGISKSQAGSIRRGVFWKGRRHE